MKVDSIVDDIIRFSDAFTDPKVKSVSGRTRVSIMRNARERAFDIDPETGVIRVRNSDRRYPDIGSLLASEEFANLSRFSETVLRALPASRYKSPIPVTVRCNGVLTDICDTLPLIGSDGSRTSMLLLDGPAGIGKTFQLERLVLDRARRFQAGKRVAPVLHVSSRGRRLSNLPDVLAASTQLLGASFGAQQVPVLVRRGVLIVAIDGFDELVDADGYEDAWAALRAFIDEVGSTGTILLAARDTFVEEQELLARIDRSNSKVALSIAHVNPVSSEDAKQWLQNVAGWKWSDVNSDVGSEILGQDSYALRPFFLQQLREVKCWADVLEEGLRTFVVSRLVRREGVLIAQQLGGTTADEIVPRILQLLQEVALEMGERELDSVELEHLAFLTEFCFEGALDRAQIRKLMHKAGSLALMEEDPLARGRRRFPHEQIQSFFLARGIIDQIRARSIPSVLRRGVLGGEFLEVFEEVLGQSHDDVVASFAWLSGVSGAEMSADGLLGNAGAMLTVAFGLGIVKRLDYLRVREGALVGLSPAGIISGSEYGRLDARGSNLSEVVFENVNVETLVVDDQSVFGARLPDVSVVEVRSPDGRRLIRGRYDVADVLASHQIAAAVSSVSAERIRLLERLARRAMRHFYLRERGDQDAGSQLLKHAEWPIVARVLERHARIEYLEGRQMHGASSRLIRIKNPRSLLISDDPETLSICRDLRSSDG